MIVHHYAIYDQAGEIVSRGRSTNPAIIDLARENLAEGQGLYEGEIDPKTAYLPGGVLTPRQAPLRSVSRAEVKAHAARLLSYSDWYVTRRSDTGEDMPAEIAAYRQAVRDASDMEPIPADYRDPKYWPVAP